MRICLIMFAFLSFASLAGAENLVFISAGQSNSGCCGETAMLTPEQDTIPHNVEYWHNGMRRYNFSETKYFGPEVSLIHDLSVLYPEDMIIFIRETHGGTSITRWIPSGDLYGILLSNVSIALGARPASFAALFWTQGERDGGSLPLAAYYHQRLAQFVNHLRNDLAAPDMPAFYAVVSNRTPYAFMVAQAQAEAAKRRFFYPVTTLNLAKRPDGLHYDTAGQLDLGRRYFEALGNATE